MLEHPDGEIRSLYLHVNAWPSVKIDKIEVYSKIIENFGNDQHNFMNFYFK